MTRTGDDNFGDLRTSDPTQWSNIGKLSGLLTVLGHSKFTVRIGLADCDSEGCSFEVIDNAEGEVFTWHVEPHVTRLIGSRNCGHMTPWGVGTCTRSFRVRASRVSK